MAIRSLSRVRCPISNIVVLEQKTAAAFVACFRAGRTTVVIDFRDQQGELKTSS
jgi:hypothetical protein